MVFRLKENTITFIKKRLLVSDIRLHKINKVNKTQVNLIKT